MLACNQVILNSIAPKPADARLDRQPPTSCVRVSPNEGKRMFQPLIPYTLSRSAAECEGGEVTNLSGVAGKPVGIARRLEGAIFFRASPPAFSFCDRPGELGTSSARACTWPPIAATKATVLRCTIARRLLEYPGAAACLR